MSEILTLKNISKTFYDKNAEIEILKDVNLSIESGKSTAIIGPSGSGKSTLLHIASLLENPTSGKIIINGNDVTILNDKQKSNFRSTLFSFVFQNDCLFLNWSLEDNVMLPIILKHKPTKKDREKCDYLLSVLSLTERRNMKVKKLSGGEKSRVSLLRALLSDSPIMFLDEPTGSLDSDNAKLVEDLIFELSEKLGKTVVLVTHSSSMANRTQYIYEIQNKTLRRVK